MQEKELALFRQKYFIPSLVIGSLLRKESLEGGRKAFVVDFCCPLFRL
jgi:hypothetical protein